MRTPDRFHLMQILLAVLAAVGVHGILWQGSYEVFSSSVDFNQGALEDFMRVYLPAADGFAAGHEPVAGFLYAPFFPWLLQPLAKLVLQRHRGFGSVGNYSRARCCWGWVGGGPKRSVEMRAKGGCRSTCS